MSERVLDVSAADPGASGEPPVVHAVGLVKEFLGGDGGVIRVLDEVSITVKRGEMVAVVGASGAGKSTLLHVLGALERPSAGRIALAGQSVGGLDDEAVAKLRNRTVGFVFQFHHLLREFSALENVALAVQARSGSSYQFIGRADRESALNDAAMEALTEVSLDARADVLAAHLSHGEKRALELAIALAMQPKLLLLDEPMAGTGPEESERLIVVLQKLKGRFAMMLVEHDMNAVFALADRISVLTYGRILASGPPAQVRADPAVMTAYLGEELE